MRELPSHRNITVATVLIFLSAATRKVRGEIIRLFLDRGTDATVVGQGQGRQWSAVQLAKYTGVDDSIIELLTKKMKKQLGDKGQDKGQADIDKNARIAKLQVGSCDGCLS